MLKNGVFGNPHSSNPTSRAITETIERTRGRVLEYFNADPDEFCAIFTSNATGAIKIVAESYPFGPTGRYLLTFDNHNSVNGIREFARARGSEVTYVPVQLPDLRIDDGELRKTLASNTSAGDVAGPKLFAYPAQSNMSGVQHSLEWIEEAQESGWDVLLDAAAFVSCSELDISRWKPDFVPISFYKIFGYPTGIGCLIARKSALEKLEKPWFAGGTISISSVQADQHHLEESEAAFEEGTVNYLSLPAVGIGLDSMESAGLDNIHKRVGALTSLLLDQLSSIVHVNGQPLIRIYGPTDMNSRGGTVSVNFYDPEGTLIDHRVVEALVDDEISIGDYVLTNGAIAAAVFVDAVVRLIPGVLGDERSPEEESFAEGEGLLEAPCYTRPVKFEGMEVPEILLSGHHERIDEWQRKRSVERTLQNRPDLLPGDESE